MPHHDRVKSLVQKQNLVALERLLDKLENPDIVRIYEALTNREPQIIWQMVSDTLKEGAARSIRLCPDETSIQAELENPP